MMNRRTWLLAFGGSLTVLVAAHCLLAILGVESTRSDNGLLGTPSFDVTSQQVPDAWAEPSFLENRGQWSDGVRFMGSFDGMVVGVQKDGVALRLNETSEKPAYGVKLEFVGEATQDIEGGGLLPGIYNIYTDKDASNHAHGARRYKNVLCKGVYPGVDVKLRENRGEFEYDLIVNEGAHYSDVCVEAHGVDYLEIDESGRLVMHTPVGEIIQPKPTTWQESAAGKITPVLCSYHLIDTTRYGFLADTYDLTQKLVIDPTVEWLGYLGGDRQDYAYAVDQGGDSFYFGGSTISTNFGADFGVGPLQGPGESKNFCYVGAAHVSGQIEWLTVFGEGKVGAQHVSDVRAKTQASAVYAVGFSSKDSMATLTSAGAQPVSAGGNEGFVVKFDAITGQVLSASYVGGSKQDQLNGVALDSEGFAYVCGFTKSEDLATVGTGGGAAFQGEYAGGFRDGYIAKLSKDLSYFEFLTYLGSSADEILEDIDVVSNTSAGSFIAVTGYIRGDATSAPYPTTVADLPPAIFNVYAHALTTKLDLDASQIEFSQLWGGGIPGEVFETTSAQCVAICQNTGEIYVAGDTGSSQFPVTPGVFAPTSGTAAQQGFIVKHANPATGIEAATFIPWFDSLLYVTGIDVAKGLVAVSGRASSTIGGVNEEAFCLLANRQLSNKYSSMSLNGPLFDRFEGVSFDAIGGVALVGHSLSPSSSIEVVTGTPALYPSQGGYDAWLTRVDMLPHGVSRYGEDTPGASGSLLAGATSVPYAGSSTFGLWVAGNPGDVVALAFSTADQVPPLVVAGAKVNISPPLTFDIQTLVLDESGLAELSYPLTGIAEGVTFYVQAFVPQADLTLASSYGLKVTTQ